MSILPLRLFDKEMVGIDCLRELAAELYGDQDPVNGYDASSPFDIADADTGEVIMSLSIPFAEKAELDVVRTGDELYITVGPYRRSFVLPDSLRRRTVEGATLEDGTLVVTFGAAA